MFLLAAVFFFFFFFCWGRPLCAWDPTLEVGTATYFYRFVPEIGNELVLAQAGHVSRFAVHKNGPGKWHWARKFQWVAALTGLRHEHAEKKCVFRRWIPHTMLTAG